MMSDRRRGRARDSAAARDPSEAHFHCGCCRRELHDTVRGMWDDFHAMERFNPDIVCLAFVTLNKPARCLDPSDRFCTARMQRRAADFRRRAPLDGYLSQTAKWHYGIIIQIL